MASAAVAAAAAGVGGLGAGTRAVGASSDDGAVVAAAPLAPSDDGRGALAAETGVT